MKSVIKPTVLAVCLAFLSCPSSAGEPAAEKAAERPATAADNGQPGQPLKLPGLEINFQERFVDIESSVCLERGMLELVACTEGTKEHESIVAIRPRPIHVHTALLLLGAENGNPAMRKPVDEQRTRWVDLPPRGDPIDVYLLLNSGNGEWIEHPISDFISRSRHSPEEQFDPENADDDGDGTQKRAEADARFWTHTFLFAGSQLVRDGPGPRKYLSELSGNVISVVTFGDEMLCLPAVRGHANHSLMWQIKPGTLPKVGTKVTLRLRPKFKAPNSSDARPAEDVDQGTE